MALRISRNHDRGDEQPDADPERERLWLLMSNAIDRYEHAQMVAREGDDPFWDEMARISGEAAEQAVKAYEAAEGG